MPTRSCLLWMLLMVQGTPAGELRAGAARVDITPPTGHPMWGYAARRDAPSKGVRDRLQARALVLEVGKTRLALVALDLGRPPTRASTEVIHHRLRKQANVEGLFLVASHTHHGPILEIDTWPTPETSYVRELERKLGDVVLEAVRGLKPARLGLADRETTLNRNRHSKRKDPPVDRLLSVLRVEDEAGKPIAHAIHFAAHPTMLPVGLMQFSADYVGVCCAAVEKETGAPCLFLQGAAGDLSPNPTKGRGPEAFGAALAAVVLDVAKQIRCEQPRSEAIRFHKEELRFQPRVDLKNPLWRIGLGTAFYPAFISFYEREYRDGVRPSLAIALLPEDQVAFLGVSGEVFCDHAMQLRRRARLEHLLFLGYCNDYHQYFPTIEAVTEGGYGTEVYIGTAEVGAGEQMMNQALKALYRLRGKLK